jgi:Tol biopolymer transport system component
MLSRYCSLRRLLILVVLAIVSVLVASCTQVAPESTEPSFETCQGPFLGLESPGDEARLFAPGLLSTEMNDRDIAISPALEEIIFGVLESPHNTLFSTQQQADGSWTRPQLLPFCGRYDDIEPHFSPDGSRLYFCSNRPLEEGGPKKDYDIWFVERVGDGWGQPQNPGPPLNSEEDEFYPSVTRDGNVFFTSADMRIMVCEMGPQGLQPRQPLPDTVNSGRAEYNAYVDSDQTYLIFTSHGWGGGAGRGDLFVSFYRDGHWTAAKSLGPGVNSDLVDISPSMSPDGRYLFFSSMRKRPGANDLLVTSYDDTREQARSYQNGKMDIYWVSASVLEALAAEESTG